MTTWIFQANPDRYDIDGFLASGIPTILFSASRSESSMEIGDTVFLWRSGGRERGVAGIVGEARIIEPPSEQADDREARRFWRDPTTGEAPAMRVRLEIRRTANSKQVLKRDWMLDDTILNDLAILRMANATNYTVPPEHARRLGQLWAKTGFDWDRDDTIAGLWTFAQTQGHPVSRKPGSPVAETALLIGRAITGVYNKVMNFRSLDPTDERAGLPATGKMDRQVWLEFFDPARGQLNIEELSAEHRRLWIDPRSSDQKPDAAIDAEGGRREAERLRRSKSLEELEALHNEKIRNTGDPTRPRKKFAQTTVFERDPLVVALRKARARNSCEADGCPHPSFYDLRGERYTEVHHIVALAEGGADTLENTICLCASHHVEAHRGKRRDELAESFRLLRAAEGKKGAVLAANRAR